MLVHSCAHHLWCVSVQQLQKKLAHFSNLGAEGQRPSSSEEKTSLDVALECCRKLLVNTKLSPAFGAVAQAALSQAVEDFCAAGFCLGNRLKLESAPSGPDGVDAGPRSSMFRRHHARRPSLSSDARTHRFPSRPEQLAEVAALRDTTAPDRCAQEPVASLKSSCLFGLRLSVGDALKLRLVQNRELSAVGADASE